MVSDQYVEEFTNQVDPGSGIGAAICAITANDARQALRAGQIQHSAFYQQTKEPS